MIKPSVVFFTISIQIFANFSAKSQDTLSRPYDEKLVEQFLKKNGTKSLVIGVIKDGVQTVKGYGKINSWGEKNVTPDGNTIYEIGSITKVFTTLLLADQIKKGSIQLNTPILSLLPKSEKQYSRSLQNINILNLATHTSGLPRITTRSVNGLILSHVFYPWGVYRFLFGYDPYSRYDTTKLFKDLRNVQLETKPGTKFSYSNFGVTLLGYLVAHKSKMSYDSLLTKQS